MAGRSTKGVLANGLGACLRSNMNPSSHASEVPPDFVVVLVGGVVVVVEESNT